MSIQESLLTAFGGLRANKLRSLLTMLGVIIGVASVIALSSLGAGLSEFIGGLITGTGADLITVSGTDEGGYPSLTLADMDRLSEPESAPDIGRVAGVTSVNTSVVATGISKLTSVSGVTDNYFAINNITDLADGALFSDSDGQVVVLSSPVADYLFPVESAVGSTVTIAEQSFEVIGVLAVEEAGGLFGPPNGGPGGPPNGGPGGPPNGGPGGGPGGGRGPFTSNVAEGVFMPLESAIETLSVPATVSGEVALSSIHIAATDESAVESAITQIRTVLRATHGLESDANDDFRLRSSAASAAIISSITSALTLFVSSIAAISLVVGGIGIMNIMLVSVTERTREIGIRKAVGATQCDILLQFVLEALVLSLVGGLIGLLLGWAVSLIGSNYIGIDSVLTLSTVGLAIGFSMTVGTLTDGHACPPPLISTGSLGSAIILMAYANK